MLADIPTPGADHYAVYSSTHTCHDALDHLGKHLPRRIDTDA